MAGTRVEGWKMGWEPGMARSKGETWVLGGEVLSMRVVVVGVVEVEKSFRGVLSWAWISMPTVSSQPGIVWLSGFFFFFLFAGEVVVLRALESSFSCLRRGVIGGLGEVVYLRWVREEDCRARGIVWCGGRRQPRRLSWPLRRYLPSSFVDIRAIGVLRRRGVDWEVGDVWVRCWIEVWRFGAPKLPLQITVKAPGRVRVTSVSPANDRTFSTASRTLCQSRKDFKLHAPIHGTHPHLDMDGPRME